ncbi:MAG: alpha/beta hydrolase, partial [Muribaculaceae bacterium]|nr:alpha/beta hydrolase [Muribaculaceae bacterium]
LLHHKTKITQRYATPALTNIGEPALTSSDVVVYNVRAGITLGATLTMPADGNPAAALVLATGSGQQNRDEEIMGHRPFKAIAEHLSSRGYAVLRFDDRGVGESGGDPSKSTLDDYVTDLSAAIAKVDSCMPGRIPVGVLGHSEGGSAAIKIAGKDSGCSFIITMGAPAWSGDSIIMSQARAMAVAMMGRWEAEASQRRILDLVKSDIPTIMLRVSLHQLIAEQLGGMANMPDVMKQVSAQVEVLCSLPYRSMVRYNPEDDIREVGVPWLALNGDKDMQVLPANLDAIKALNPDADTRLMPGLNHLMQDCTTGLVQEYVSISQDISPTALEAITSWLDVIIAR